MVLTVEPLAYGLALYCFAGLACYSVATRPVPNPVGYAGGYTSEWAAAWALLSVWTLSVFMFAVGAFAGFVAYGNLVLNPAAAAAQTLPSGCAAQGGADPIPWGIPRGENALAFASLVLYWAHSFLYDFLRMPLTASTKPVLHDFLWSGFAGFDRAATWIFLKVASCLVRVALIVMQVVWLTDKTNFGLGASPAGGKDLSALPWRGVGVCAAAVVAVCIAVDAVSDRWTEPSADDEDDEETLATLDDRASGDEPSFAVRTPVRPTTVAAQAAFQLFVAIVFFQDTSRPVAYSIATTIVPAAFCAYRRSADFFVDLNVRCNALFFVTYWMFPGYFQAAGMSAATGLDPPANIAYLFYLSTWCAPGSFAESDVQSALYLTTVFSVVVGISGLLIPRDAPARVGFKDL